MTTIGAFLFEARKRGKLEIEEVVIIFKNKYNISTSYDTLKRVENNKRTLPINEAVALSKVYKFDIQELIKLVELEMFNKL